MKTELETLVTALYPDLTDQGRLEKVESLIKADVHGPAALNIEKGELADGTPFYHRFLGKPWKERLSPEQKKYAVTKHMDEVFSKPEWRDLKIVEDISSINEDTEYLPTCETEKVDEKQNIISVKVDFKPPAITPKFKPGDRVRVTEKIREYEWKSMHEFVGMIVIVGRYRGGWSDVDGLVDWYKDNLESWDWPSDCLELVETCEHCGKDIDHWDHCPTEGCENYSEFPF